MIIEEYIRESKIVNAKFDLAMTKASAVAESSFNDMNLFMSQAELKVMTESGTIDDLWYYREEATEGFVGKAREVILAIIEALKDFFSELKTKIVKLFAGGDVTKTLEEVEKKARLNPFLKNKKVKIPDFNKQDEAMKDYDRRLGKLLASSKAGSKVSPDDVEEEEDKFNKAWAAALAAVTTITVIALVGLTRKLQKNIESDVDSNQRETIGRMKNAEDKVKDMVDPDKVAVLTKITQKTAQNARRESSWRVNTLVKCIAVLKKAVHSKDAFVSPGDTLSYESGDSEDIDLEKVEKDLEKDKDLNQVTKTEESAEDEVNENGDELNESDDGIDESAVDEFDEVCKNSSYDEGSCGRGCNEGDCGRGCNEGDDPVADSVQSTYDEFDEFLDANASPSDEEEEIDSFVNAMDDAVDDYDTEHGHEHCHYHDHDHHHHDHDDYDHHHDHDDHEHDHYGDDEEHCHYHCHDNGEDGYCHTHPHDPHDYDHDHDHEAVHDDDEDEEHCHYHCHRDGENGYCHTHPHDPHDYDHDHDHEAEYDETCESVDELMSELDKLV